MARRKEKEVQQLDNRLFEAVNAGSIPQIEAALAEGADINHLDSVGYSLLNYAAYRGKLNIVKFLLNEKQMDPHQINLYGHTPLHSAAWSGYVLVVKLLIEEHQVDFSICSKTGKTALDKAKDRGYTDVVEYLQKIEADGGTSTMTKFAGMGT